MWNSDRFSAEPPYGINHVRDGRGSIADRTEGPCDYCEQGSFWRWRHNGGTACWLDIDGIGPWIEWDPPEDGTATTSASR